MSYPSLLLTLLALLLFASCEKVIDIKLPDSEPVPVIEAYLQQGTPCFATISETIAIFEEDSLRVIEDAVVTLEDDLGLVEQLTHQGNGSYTGQIILGTVGRTYTLSVQVDGKTYKANSTIFAPVAIDSITIKPDTSIFFNPGATDFYDIDVHFKDPAAIQNYYHVQSLYVPQNGSINFNDRRGFAFSDANNGGANIRLTLFTQEVESGDEVFVQLRNIDEGVYDYFRTIGDALVGNSFTSAAPANPKSNFSNGALGYFSAAGVDLASYTIP